MVRVIPPNRIAATLIVSALILAATTVNSIAADNDYLLHLPGIAGTKQIDRAVNKGIKEGGFDGTAENYDWTENNPGMAALLAYERNQREAKLISDKIVKQRTAVPTGKFYLLGHSGGAGLAVWALEDLPDNITVDSVVLMSPALSPNYDLTRALKHVTGHIYVFSSLTDVFVLGVGTKLFGTIDGVKTDAAGRVGFSQPPTADAQQYRKLVALPYDTSWFKYGDAGDHIGGMRESFGENILAPLLLEGKMPPTNMPTTTETPTGVGREMPTTVPASIR
jgi:pimeloyl-ACP methyl ester carboxylesterase